MSQGPAGFLEGIGRMVQRTGTEGEQFNQLMRFMRDRLSQVFGPEQTRALVNFWTTMDDHTLESMRNIEGASVSLGDLARQAHTTGRDLNEIFDRMRAGFQTRLRRVVRGDTYQFLRDTRSSLRDLGDSMMEFARSTGPVGTAMGAMLRSQQLGSLALLPAELRGSAIAADELRGQILPLVQAFTSWGGILNTVLGYVGLFATDVISDFGRIRRASRDMDPLAALGQAVEQQVDRYSKIIVRFIGNAEQWVVQIAEAFGDLDWGQLFATGTDDRGGIMGAIRQIADRIGEIDWGRIWNGVSKGFNRLFSRVNPWIAKKVDELKTVVGDRISAWWGSIDWRNVFREIGTLAVGLWEALQPALSLLGSWIGGWLQDHWFDIVMFSEAALATAMGVLVIGAVAAAVAIAVAPFVGMWKMLTSGWEEWGDTILSYFEEWGEDFDTWWNDLIEGLRAHFASAWKTMQGRVDSLWSSIVSAPERIQTAWSGTLEYFAGIFGQLKGLIAPVVGMFDRVRDAGTGAFNAILARVIENHGHSVNTIVGEDMAATEEVMTATATNISEVMQAVLHDATVDAIVTGFASGFDMVVDNMDEFSDRMLDSFRSLSYGISGIMTELFMSVIAQSLGTMLATEAAVEGITARLRTITEANRQLARSREAAAQVVSPAGDEAIYRRRVEALRGNEILASINLPLWWDAPGVGYKAMFERLMNELIRVVAAMGASRGPTGEAARGNIERLASLVSEAQTSGHRRGPATRAGTRTRR
jgi:hypothetical protein